MDYNAYKIIQQCNMYTRGIWVKWLHFQKQEEDTENRYVT